MLISLIARTVQSNGAVAEAEEQAVVAPLLLIPTSPSPPPSLSLRKLACPCAARAPVVEYRVVPEARRRPTLQINTLIALAQQPQRPTRGVAGVAAVQQAVVARPHVAGKAP